MSDLNSLHFAVHRLLEVVTDRRYQILLHLANHNNNLCKATD